LRGQSGAKNSAVATIANLVKVNGTTHYLWRAVDQHGSVLDMLVQSRRNAVAAKKFFRRLRKGLQFVPRVIVTDKASYRVAHREMVPSVQHRRYVSERSSRELPPTHPCPGAGDERFASPGQAQRFCSRSAASESTFGPAVI
jgi:putative transposase